MSDKEVIENKQNNIQENPFLLDFALLIHFTAMFGSKRVLQFFFFSKQEEKGNRWYTQIDTDKTKKKN